MSDENNLPAELENETVDPLGSLKPRQRRLAQLLAEGKTNSDIQAELGYCASRISILQNDPFIRREVARLQDRIFEAGIETRLKDFNNAALDHIEFVLTDKRNVVKTSEKNEIAKWVIEMQKSKAPQVHDIGQNMLAALMDRLDARKTERKALTPAPTQISEATSEPLDVSYSLATDSPKPPAPAPEKDELAEWVDDFCGES